MISKPGQKEGKASKHHCASCVVLPSSLLYRPSSSWPHRTWTARPGWGRGWERAECCSTEFPPPRWLWSARTHLRGKAQNTEGFHNCTETTTKTHNNKTTIQQHMYTHQICPCTGSAGGLRFWTLPPASSVECWPPTWEWSGSRSLPLNQQHMVSTFHSYALQSKPLNLDCFHQVISHD